jgi:hypothetical protein
MFRILAGVLATAVVLGGCALSLGNPSIGELQRNPGRYVDRTVSVEGRVTTSWGVPLVPFKFYRVDDGTGEVTVLSNGSRTPPSGSRVRVKGRVNEVAVLGGRSVGLHLEERDLDFRR